MHEFKGKVVLVTAAGKGLGRAVARAFAAKGARVAANDITPVNLKETLALINDADRKIGAGSARDYVYDIANRMHVRSLVSQILDDWGRIDILVNHVQVDPQTPLMEMDEWGWRRTLDVNLSGPFFTMQTVGRVMRDAGGGVIINLINNRLSTQAAPGRSAYVASNSGLVGLTRVAAREFDGYKIRVHGLILGDTDLIPARGDDPALVLLKDDGLTPESITQEILRLCFDESNSEGG